MESKHVNPQMTFKFSRTLEILLAALETCGVGGERKRDANRGAVGNPPQTSSRTSDIDLWFIFQMHLARKFILFRVEEEKDGKTVNKEKRFASVCRKLNRLHQMCIKLFRLGEPAAGKESCV